MLGIADIAVIHQFAIHSTRVIADMLYVSMSTVKSHRAKIMEKLDIDSPVKLVHFAIKLGLVDPDL